MANLPSNSTQYYYTRTLDGPGNYSILLSTQNTFVDKNISVSMSLAQSVPAADTASANIEQNSTAASAGGTKINGALISAISGSEPSSGYFIGLNATGSGNSKITTAGWIDAGSLASASTTVAKYITINPAHFTVSQNKVYCDTAGYVPQGSTSNVIGTVSTGTITNNVTSLPSGVASTADIDRGKYIKIGSGYYSADAYYRATPNSGTLTITAANHSARTDITVDGYAKINATGITVPKDKQFTVYTTADTALDTTSDLDITNRAYRRVDITNEANGTVLVANSGIATITSGSTSAGTVSINAYPASGSTLDGEKTIVSGGRWTCTPTFNGAGTYYGKVIVGSVNASLGGSTTTNGKASAAITNTNSINATTTAPSGTAGTDYWQIQATASITTTPKFTPSLTLTTIGWMATAPTGSETNVTVNGDSTGKSLYIPKAVFDGNGGSVAKFTTDGSNAGVNKTSILGNATTTEPSSGLYVSFKGSGSSIVSTAGYVPADTVTTTGTSAATYFSLPTGSVTSGTASITSVTYTYQSSPDNFKLAGTADVSAPTVDTNGAGYIDSTYGARNYKSGGASINATVAKIAGSNSITGTLKYTPTISKQATPSGTTDAASGDATTTAPSSGVYVAVKATGGTNTVTASTTISTNGYGTSTYHGIVDGTASVGANDSVMTYVPITTMPALAAPANSATSGYSKVGSNVDRSTSVRYINIPPGYHTTGQYYQISAVANGTTKPPTTATGTGATLTTGDGTLTLTKTVSLTPRITTAGYISSGTADNCAITLTANVTTQSDLTYTSTVLNSGETAVTTYASASWSTGYITSGSIGHVTFGNAPASGKTTTSYKDLSKTDDAPVLTVLDNNGGGYLYINKGYIDDVKISLARLVPDSVDATNGFAPANYILTGYAAFDGAGAQITGTMAKYQGAYSVSVS